MNDRDQDILMFVGRFRLTDKRALHRSFFPALSEKAVERVTTRLQRQRLLTPIPLYRRLCAYTLTPKAAAELGLSPKPYERPMGAQAVLSNYAVLRYCLGQDPPLKRMTGAEFVSRLPQLNHPGLSASRYYWLKDAEAAKARLGLLLVDCGQHRRRQVRKARREVEKRLRLPSWKGIINNDLFSVAVLTAFEAKAEFLRERLAAERWHSVVAVVRELAPLLLEAPHEHADASE